MRAFDSATTWEFDIEKNTGDTEHVKLEADRFTHVDDVADLPGGSSIEDASCELDPQRDLVAPVRLTVTNTNDGFDQKVEVSFFANRDDNRAGDDGPVVYVAAFYSDGPECKGVTPFTWFDGQESWGVESVKPLGSGRHTTMTAFLILRGVLSPAHPEGDPEVFSNTFLYPYDGAGSDGTTRSLSGATGPWRLPERPGTPLTHAIPLSELTME